MFLGLIPSVKFIMKPQQTFNPHRKAASRKSEKYSNSRRGLSGRLKCKFVHKSLSRPQLRVGIGYELLYLFCAPKMFYAGDAPRGRRLPRVGLSTRHLTADECVCGECVCVWRGNPSLSLNEMKTEATHTRTHTYEHAQTCFSGL